MLKIQNLNAKYNKNDDKNTIQNINIEIPKNSFVSIVGMNGSGKSTLLKSITNSVYTSGSIKLDGEELKHKKEKERAKVVAILSQISNTQSAYTVYDMVLLGRYPHMSNSLFTSFDEDDFNIVENTLKKMNIYELKDEYITDISGGQLQRVLLARAITQQPKLLLLDEPTNHLDIKNQLELMNFCDTFKRQDNNIILAVLHDINLALKYSDYIIAIKNGEVIFYDKTEKFKEPKVFKETFDVDINKWI